MSQLPESPFRKTYLPPNKFYSAASPNAVDEAGASAPAPTPVAPAALSVSMAEPCGAMGTEAAVTVRAAAASDILQALGALSGTDLINEIFAVKPKHFKLKHKRRLKLPRFVPDYEGMEAAINDPGAPRLRADDPMWTDASPLFLRDAV